MIVYFTPPTPPFDWMAFLIGLIIGSLFMAVVALAAYIGDDEDDDDCGDE